MVAIAQKSTAPLGEQRVVFHHLDWQKYLTILSTLGEARSARLTYDAGVLEITMPLEEHEAASELLALYIRILVEELGFRLKSMGSTTLNYPELEKGAEPDKGYYIQNYSQVAGRKVDFSQDPPPDLVVEVDITHTDIDKLTLYSSMGIPEFWRFNGKTLHFYVLKDGHYTENSESPTFPSIPKDRFYSFLEIALEDEVTASQSLRTWLSNLG
ncbi:MAG: Uma2 family endonuclease [Cyanobacteria bacterium J06635_1]